MSASTGDRPGVLIIVENLPVPFDRRVWQEARTLAAHGYDVSVICPTGRGCEARQEVIDGIRVWRHPLPADREGPLGYVLEYTAALFWQLVLSARAYRRRPFRVIQACNPPDTIFLVALLYKWLLGCKFVFDHHDLNPELFVAKFGRRGWVHRVLLLLERATFRSADVVIATNESYRAIAIARGKVEPGRVFVVRSGPPIGKWGEARPEPSLKRGRRYLIGYVGVIGRQEGIEYLLHAIRHIVQVRKRTDIHFAIVGTGPHWEEVRHLSSTLRIEEFVTFTGRLSDDQLLAVLATSDLCVNPDEVNELNDLSTMNKVVEYMALGKPIVQFETREGRYSAQDAAAYAAPNDPTDLAEKILTLLARPARRQAMGEYARTRFRTVLAWDHQIPRLLDAYAAVAKPSVLAAPQEEAPVWVVRRSLAATESASAPAVGQRSAERTPAPLQTGSEP